MGFPTFAEVDAGCLKRLIGVEIEGTGVNFRRQNRRAKYYHLHEEYLASLKK